MPRGYNQIDEAIIQERLWQPSVLLPAMWLDADDISTITIATGVSEWRDKSGNGRNATQSTAGSQPAYTNNALNGKNVLTSIGSAKRLNLANRTVSNSTFFMVLNDSRNTGFAVAFILNGGSGTKVHNLLTHFAGFNKWGSYTTTDRPANSDINTNYAIASVENNATDFVFYKDGKFDGTQSNSGNAFTTSHIFNDQYGSFFTGNIAEILFFDSVLTTSNREIIEGYLAWKWGLVSNLPATHPYINRPPLIGDN